MLAIFYIGLTFLSGHTDQHSHEYRPREVEAALLTGEPADHLHPSACLARDVPCDGDAGYSRPDIDVAHQLESVRSRRVRLRSDGR